MRIALVALVLLSACKKETPAAVPAPVAPALSPKEVSLEGAYHAVACGAVTAVWAGNADALKDLPQPAPKNFGVESLAFRFADGTSKGFATPGQLFFSDWRFDIFSPDCSSVALLTDRYGPYHVVKTADLRGYLEGRVKPTVVQAKSEKETPVHGDALWTSQGELEFTASCCGGAEVFRAKADGSLASVFKAAEAPKGLRRAAAGYEVVK